VGISVVIGISFIFNALSTVHLALLQRKMYFYKIAANEISANALSQIAAIAVALWGWGYWALVARRVVPLVFMAGGAWLLCRWIPGLPSRGTGVRSMVKFGMHTYGNFAANYMSRNLDKVLIGWRYGAQLLGYYERAYYLFVMPVNQLSHPLTSVAVAALSRMRDEPDKYRNYYLKALSMLALIGMPLSAVLTLVGRDALLLLLGSQWGEAGKIFSVFGPGIGITLIYGTHGWLHLSLGRADRWLRWGVIELLITVICFIIGLPFGVIGVAVAYTASFYVLVGPGLWYAGNPAHIKLSSYIIATGKYFVSALAAGILCWYILYSLDITSHIFVSLPIFMRITISAGLCVILYIFMIVIIFRSKNSVEEFISLVKNVIANSAIKEHI
jgi:PST family polysaccharide transporter